MTQDALNNKTGKQLINRLKNGKLKPKERIFLLMQDIFSRETTGKEILTTADRQALDKWTPKTDEEAEEYRHYNEGWKTSKFIDLKAQTSYLKARLGLEEMHWVRYILVLTPYIYNLKNLIEGLDKIRMVDLKEAIEIGEKQRKQKLKDGMALDELVHCYAFSCLDRRTKKKFLKLDENAKTEPAYLNNEVELARYYRNRNYNAIAEKVSYYDTSLSDNYASIPIEQVARRFLNGHNIKIPKSDKELDVIDEALEKYASENKTTVAKTLKTTMLAWLKKGLLEKDYPPLIVTHPKLFDKWVKTKEKARQIITQLINQGILKTFIKDETKESYPHTHKKIAQKEAIYITGESLYNLPREYSFSYLNNFKEYIDNYEPGFGMVRSDDRRGYLDEELLISSGIPFCHLWQAKMVGYEIVNSLFVTKEIKKKTITPIGEDKIIAKIKGKLPEITVIDLKGHLKSYFKEAISIFRKHYEKILAFDRLFEKLSKIYRFDYAYKTKIWIARLETLANKHNDMLKTSLKKFNFLSLPQQWGKSIREFKNPNELLIDLEKIKPKYDEEIRGYLKIFSDMFGKKFR